MKLVLVMIMVCNLTSCSMLASAAKYVISGSNAGVRVDTDIAKNMHKTNGVINNHKQNNQARDQVITNNNGYAAWQLILAVLSGCFIGLFINLRKVVKFVRGLIFGFKHGKIERYTDEPHYTDDITFKNRFKRHD